jgi:hypothetical protein
MSAAPFVERVWFKLRKNTSTHKYIIMPQFHFFVNPGIDKIKGKQAVLSAGLAG